MPSPIMDILQAIGNIPSDIYHENVHGASKVPGELSSLGHLIQDTGKPGVIPKALEWLFTTHEHDTKKKLLSNQTHVTLKQLQKAAKTPPRTLYAENVRYLLSPFQHTINQLPSEYLSAMQSALSPTASPYTPSGSEAPEEQSMESALQNLGSKTSPMYKALKGMGVDMRGYERVAPYTSLITGLISHLRYLTEYTGAGSLSPHVPGWLQTLAATSAGSGPVQFGKGSTGNMAQEMLKVKGLSTKKQTTTTPTSTSTNSTPG